MWIGLFFFVNKPQNERRSEKKYTYYTDGNGKIK